VRAGYGDDLDSAKANASRLIANDNVRARIDELKQDRIGRVEVKQDDVLKELLIMMKSSIHDYEFDEKGYVVVRPESKEEMIRAVSSVKRRIKKYTEGSGDNARPVEVEEIEYRLWPKDKAVEMAMRHLGILNDKLRVALEDPDDVLARTLGLSKEDIP
jgi:phage terminase small subunit